MSDYAEDVRWLRANTQGIVDEELTKSGPVIESQPKCLRVVVTAVFADGHSSILDIPEPILFEAKTIEFEPEDIEEYLLTKSVKHAIILTAALNPKFATLESVVPRPSLCQSTRSSTIT